LELISTKNIAIWLSKGLGQIITAMREMDIDYEANRN
jgi:hypothetical protein